MWTVTQDYPIILFIHLLFVMGIVTFTKLLWVGIQAFWRGVKKKRVEDSPTDIILRFNNQGGQQSIMTVVKSMRYEPQTTDREITIANILLEVENEITEWLERMDFNPK